MRFPRTVFGDTYRALFQSSILILLLCFALYAACNWALVWDISAGANGRPLHKTVVRVACLCLGFIGFVFGAMRLSTAWKWLLVLAAFVSVAVNLSLYIVSSSVLGPGLTTWLLSEAHQLPAALQEYGAPILTSWVMAAIAVGALAILSMRLHRLEPRPLKHLYTRSGFFASVAVFMLIPVATSAGLMNLGVAEHNVFDYAIRSLGEPDAPPPGSLQPPALEPPRAKHIVLVVDESTTPAAFSQWVLPKMGVGPVQYGTTYSTGNCSAVSQALIRWGVEPARVGQAHDPRAQVPLWNYARAAGFRTVLIDGQVTAKAQNYMRREELLLIDEFLPFQRGVDTDRLIAVELARRLRTDQPPFIYVVKRGSHFPYSDNVSPGLNSGALSQMETYALSVRDSTGAFFAQLQQDMPDLKDTLLYYTSDHGQHFGGGPLHCSGAYREDEFEVPMAVLGERAAYLQQLRDAQACWTGVASHQNLRSTVIESMGYPKAWVERFLLPSLSACSSDHRAPRLLSSTPYPTKAEGAVRFESVANSKAPLGAIGVVAQRASEGKQLPGSVRYQSANLGNSTSGPSK